LHALFLLLARAHDRLSPLTAAPFPETLLESELFGYMKGAFYRRQPNKRGLFEVASGGTFSGRDQRDECLHAGELLRVLQERSVRPIGGAQETAIDVRVIAATTRTSEN